MGTVIGQEEFDENDYFHFAGRLEECLSALGRLLDRPGFGVGPATVGAELELFLVDGAARPLRFNQAIRAAAADPRITVELDRFNLELNASPAPLAGRPFATLGGELNVLLDHVAHAARDQPGRLALIGILPTLTQADLGPGLMTDMPPYRALSSGLRRLRQDPFRIRITGEDPLELACEDVALQGATTSFHVHLRVNPADFTRTYNAVQLATAPVLAVSGNSPTFLGHRLWQETRIALLKQSVDDRQARSPRRRLARTALGTGWLRGGALELFTESVRLHQPLLPVLGGPGPPAGQVRVAGAAAGRTQAAPRHRVALEPGHLRPRVRRASADRDASPARWPHRHRHAGQRRFLDRAVIVAGGAGPAVDLRAAFRACRPWFLPRRPARPVRPAELASRAPRSDADASRCQARGRVGAGGTAGPAPGGRGSSRGGRAARSDLSPGGLGSDRRSLAARHAGRRRATS